MSRPKEEEAIEGSEPCQRGSSDRSAGVQVLQLASQFSYRVLDGIHSTDRAADDREYRAWSLKSFPDNRNLTETVEELKATIIR